MVENVEKFIGAMLQSLKNGSFVKLSLGNYKGTDPHLQKLLIRTVSTKKGSRLYFLYRGASRDIAKNYDVDLGISMIAEALDGQFFGGHLFTTENDFQLDISKKGKSRLNIGKPTFKSKPSESHNREKNYQVDPDSFFLKALGITDETGRIRDKQQDKWRQINKFVEVLSNLFDKSELRSKESISLIDMGCGKGYLTFAAYDHFKNTRKIDVSVTGVDTKYELVELCNEIAKTCDFDGLSFVVGTIADYNVDQIDVLVALLACNTATDDALFKGIEARADLILAAPCCHQQIRPQIKSPEMLRDVLKHGVMLERFAELITDGMRSLLLERSGYATKLFEFVSTEHTPKNNMLVGTRLKEPADLLRFDEQITEICTTYGISEHRLMELLRSRDN